MVKKVLLLIFFINLFMSCGGERTIDWDKRALEEEETTADGYDSFETHIDAKYSLENFDEQSKILHILITPFGVKKNFFISGRLGYIVDLETDKVVGKVAPWVSDKGITGIHGVELRFNTLVNRIRGFKRVQESMEVEGNVSIYNRNKIRYGIKWPGSNETSFIDTLSSSQIISKLKFHVLDVNRNEKIVEREISNFSFNVENGHLLNQSEFKKVLLNSYMAVKHRYGKGGFLSGTVELQLPLCNGDGDSILINDKLKYLGIAGLQDSFSEFKFGSSVITFLNLKTLVQEEAKIIFEVAE